jgi:hypothetical protein
LVSEEIKQRNDARLTEFGRREYLVAEAAERVSGADACRTYRER